MINLLKAAKPTAAFIAAGQKYTECVTQEIENFQIYPRLANAYRDVVLLALLDKVLTTARAVICLAREGFPADAFGLSRTAVEAFYCFRYIGNKDSEERAKRFIDYFAKDRQNLTNLIEKHHPHLSGG